MCKIGQYILKWGKMFGIRTGKISLLSSDSFHSFNKIYENFINCNCIRFLILYPARFYSYIQSMDIFFHLDLCISIRGVCNAQRSLAIQCDQNSHFFLYKLRSISHLNINNKCCWLAEQTWMWPLINRRLY